MSKSLPLLRRPQSLPDGLTWPDVDRLKNYAERLVEHGIEALEHHNRQIREPTIGRHFYLEALQSCRPLSIVTVETLGLLQADSLVDYFGSSQAAKTIHSIEAFYRGDQKLPNDVASRIDLVEGIETWAALSDLTHFANAFFTKRIPEPDSRDIQECLTQSLIRNDLSYVFNLTRFTVFPGQDETTADLELEIPLRPYGEYDNMMSGLLDDRFVGKAEPK